MKISIFIAFEDATPESGAYKVKCRIHLHYAQDYGHLTSIDPKLGE